MQKEEEEAEERAILKQERKQAKQAKRKVNWAACLLVSRLTAWLCRRRKRKLKNVQF